MADDQQFCLRWNNFQTNFTSEFKTLRSDEDFVDVTLACEGKRVKAHKLVLSACSPYFKELFKGNPCKHPIIFMQDVQYEHLINLVEFMYAGQVNICQTKLPDFLHTAESLQIRGLSQNKLPHPQGIISNEGELRADRLLVKDEPDADLEPSDELSEGGEEVLSQPLPSSSKRLNNQTTSYNDVPTTAVIETKMEPMDYHSDNEAQLNVSHSSNTENLSMNMSNMSGYSIQGVLDAAASMTSHVSQMQESNQESLQGWRRRQAMREFLTTESSSRSSGGNNKISLGFGVEVSVHQLRGVKWSDYRKLTRSLASILFSHQELATRSVTGQRWSRYLSAGDDRPVKPALDPSKINAIITYVRALFPHVAVSHIKQVLAYKCKECAAAVAQKYKPSGANR